jgi:hypothetical protein
MKLSTRFFGLLFLLFIQQSFSQHIIRTKLIDTTTNWVKKNKVGFDFSEIAFVNWNSGGTNSFSGLIKGNFSRKYKIDNLKWNNELIVRYGLNKQDGIDIRKTEDVLRCNSTFGFRTDTISKWYYSAKFNFNTQFTNGYAYPNTNRAISKPFAPAYIFLGIGSEYNDKPNALSLYISPLTLKTTLVLDQKLANQGAFGVTKAINDADGNLISKGENYRMELGFLFTSAYKKEILKNINWENRLTLYTDYINKFGNIDVDWQTQFDLKVNEYVKANIGFHIIYDDDIKAKKVIEGIPVSVGPKIQLKQMLGIGLEYRF